MNTRQIYAIIIIPLVILLVLHFGFQMDGLYGQDSYEYLRYAQSLKTYLVKGTYPGDFFWPVNYSLAGALLSFIIPDVGFCLQIISILSFSAIIIYINKIGRLIFCKITNNQVSVLVTVLTITPFMVRYSISVMSDMFVLAVIVTGTYSLIKYTKENKVIYLLLGIFLFSFSIMTRYAAIVIILPIGTWCLYTMIKHGLKWYYYMLLIIIGAIPFIPHLFLRGNESANFISHEWIKTWSLLNFTNRRSESIDGIINYPLPNIIYAILGIFHPRYLLIGLILFFVGIKKFYLNAETKVLAISTMIYLLFLAGINYQNNRFLLLILPFVLVIFYPALDASVTFIKKKNFTAFISVLVSVQIALAVFSYKAIWNRNKLERNIYTYVKQTGEPPIYTMDIDVSLKGRGYTSTIYNIWNKYYEYPDTNAIVIFNTLTFPGQWENMNPMKNWKHFNSDFHLKEVQSFDSGWKAYEFE